MTRRPGPLPVKTRIKTMQQVTLPELRTYIASGALAHKTTLFVRVILRPGEDAWPHLSPSYLEPFKASRLHRLERLEIVVELSAKVVQERAAQGFLDAVAYSLEQPVVDRYREWCLPALSTLVVDFRGTGLTPLRCEFYVAQPMAPSTTEHTRTLFRR
ncbi:uncharacterized protein BDZ99DRAFT_521150 [Mytilinidion resinicola]|uniref:Uncharacterized protein n=1 Tax=Mytilinidion resinicola TaxID=574789 RepID=A0A6A6YPC9_9PEZI|nr:uncharacterized protein BDZ99DRAFT_521150 [Mytilinidion resinicola]KAF2809835.1 hypothetical protein BDZ99DRAFT_521150 [Mytilinidion resinicola]